MNIGTEITVLNSTIGGNNNDNNGNNKKNGFTFKSFVLCVLAALVIASVILYFLPK